MTEILWQSRCLPGTAGRRGLVELTSLSAYELKGDWVEYDDTTVTIEDLDLSIDFASLVSHGLQYVSWALCYFAGMTCAPIRVLRTAAAFRCPRPRS